MWWMGLIQAGVGIAQTAIAASQKTTPMQKYSATPESRIAGQMALQTAQQGASGAERAQFNQQLARQGTAAKQIFQNVGMSGAGSAAANIMSIDALNQFAAQNSAIKRQGEGAYANWAQGMQSISDKNVAQNNQLALMEAQAQGEAFQTGTKNFVKGLDVSSNAMLANKSIDAYKKIGANANNDLGVGGGGGGFSQSPYANNPYFSGQNINGLSGYNSGIPSDTTGGFPLSNDPVLPQLINTGTSGGNWWD